nr:MAG TPA: hypothetical protein [Caudoviricetes sp.]
MSFFSHPLTPFFFSNNLFCAIILSPNKSLHRKEV